MTAAVLWAVVGIALLCAVLVSHLQLRSAVRRPAPGRQPLARYPSVSVIQPVRGLDHGAEFNLRATLEANYPGELETLFVFDDSADPAYALVERVVREHQQLGKRGR